MKTVVRIFVVLAVLRLSFGCTPKEERIIPEDDFVQIYADLFIADEWMRNHNEKRAQTDTSLVYEPIFRKYGYTTENYRKSVDYYLQDPKDYASLISRSADLLKERMEGFIAIRKARKDSVDRVHRAQDIADSLARIKDSLYRIPCKIPIFRDRVFFCDTLPYRDTVAPFDTVRWHLFDFQPDTLKTAVDTVLAPVPETPAIQIPSPREKLKEKGLKVHVPDGHLNPEEEIINIE